MKNSQKWFLVALLFAIITTCITFSSFIYSPWYHLSSEGGDGLKNVYVFLYHCMYGHGNWFEGMNYPYGEHIIYNDALPIFSLFLSSHFLITVGQGFTIMWWTIAASYILGIVYLYLILKEFSVYPVLAILFACLIAVCNPQIPRIWGHYSLSLCCIIPMIFYWTLKYLKTSKIRYPLFLFIFDCILYLIHPYFNGMLLIWGLFFCLGYLIFNKQPLRTKIRFVAIYMGSIVAVFIPIFLYMQLTDPLKDRPQIPFGALEYYTRTNDIYTSNISPIWLALKKNGLKMDLAGFSEGYCYIGITSLLILIIGVFIFCVRKIGSWTKLKPNNGKGVVNKVSFRIWIFMALGALLVGMSIPFIWEMEWLLKYLPGFRQFRALGRFSWMFYYLITVISVVALNNFFKALIEKRRHLLAYSIIVLALFTWSWEATGSIGFVWEIAKGGKFNYDWLVSYNQPSWGEFLHQKKYLKTDFQAILPMKYINQGTEKLYIDPSSNALMSRAFRASFQLHLPITANYAGRASLSVAEKQIKISDGPFTRKPLLFDAKNDKPYLMMVFKTDVLNPDEKYLFQSSDYIGDFSDCDVYAFYPARCRNNDRSWADSVKKILPLFATDTCLGNNNVVIEHFDDKNASSKFFGRGAMPAIDKDDSVIGIFNLKPQNKPTEYEFSAWFLISRADFRSPDVYLILCDSNNTQIELVGASTKLSSDAEGLWFRNSVYFVVQPNCRNIKCKVFNYQRSSYFALDEFQLRPSDAIIISKSIDGQVLVNNHLFKE